MEKIPMIHQTDLFHPHNDPDDHYDLAVVYALAHAGIFDLHGVLIDFPPEGMGDPDLMGVAQMNAITGLTVPVAVGSDRPMQSRDDIQPEGTATQLAGVNMVINTLKRAVSPVVINIVGSCRDIAIAGKKAPELFAEKCAGIYLNAGSGTKEAPDLENLEYNVRVNAAAFAGLFDLRCPIYWMPCFEDYVKPGDVLTVKKLGTYYKFQQKEILPYLSPQMQNYFLYMLGQLKNQRWLHYLEGAVDENLLTVYGEKYRNMWCTGGFFHAAGKTVTETGDIVSLDKANINPVYEFKPVTLSCDDFGVVSWEYTDQPTNRYMYNVLNVTEYQAAMTKALKHILMSLL